MTTYSIADHGSWESYIKADGFGSIRQIGTGIDWYDYRQNPANFHGGVLVTLTSDPSRPGTYTSGAAYTDRSMVSPYGRLIELLDYSGPAPSGYSPDLGSAAVTISGSSATFTKTYFLTGAQVVARMTDAEMYASYAYDAVQPLRARLTGTAVQITTFGLMSNTTDKFAATKAALASLFTAARAEVLMAAP